VANSAYRQSSAFDHRVSKPQTAKAILRMKFELFDYVELACPAPNVRGVAVGEKGRVVEIYEDGELCVEFENDEIEDIPASALRLIRRAEKTRHIHADGLSRPARPLGLSGPRGG